MTHLTDFLETAIVSSSHRGARSRENGDGVSANIHNTHHRLVPTRHRRHRNQGVAACGHETEIPNLVMTNSSPWKIIMLLIGKPSISIRAIFLVMTNSSPWFFDGPNRNRWLTYYIIAWWIFPWQTVSHNQMVFLYALVSEHCGKINSNIWVWVKIRYPKIMDG